MTFCSNETCGNNIHVHVKISLLSLYPLFFRVFKSDVFVMFCCFHSFMDTDKMTDNGFCHDDDEGDGHVSGWR